MVKFFRDVLSGPLYVIVLILSIILIMAIIGFILERKQREKAEKDKMVFVDRNIDLNNVEQAETPSDISVSVETEVEEEIPVIEEEKDNKKKNK